MHSQEQIFVSDQEETWCCQETFGDWKAGLIGRIEGVSDLCCCLALPPAGAFMTGMLTQIQPRLHESQWYFSENGIKQAGCWGTWRNRIFATNSWPLRQRHLPFTLPCTQQCPCPKLMGATVWQVKVCWMVKDQQARSTVPASRVEAGGWAADESAAAQGWLWPTLSSIPKIALISSSISTWKHAAPLSASYCRCQTPTTATLLKPEREKTWASSAVLITFLSFFFFFSLQWISEIYHQIRWQIFSTAQANLSCFYYTFRHQNSRFYFNNRELWNQLLYLNIP